MQFDDFESMAKWMDDRTNEANIGLAPEQQQVTYGDTWARFDHIDSIGLVCGRIFTKAEWLASEIAEGAPEEEANYSLAKVEQAHERGYMNSIAYSVLEPDGEYGDIHRANLWPIDEDLFHACAEARWKIENLDMGAKINLSIAFEQWRHHELDLIAEAKAKLAQERDSI